MNTRVVGNLDNRIIKSKGYSIFWHFKNAIPNGQVIDPEDLPILRSPNFKLWDTDWAFTISPLQLQELENNQESIEFNLQITLDQTGELRRFIPNTGSSMVAFYDDQSEPLKFNSEMPYFNLLKISNRIKQIASNEFGLEAYSNEQGYPDLSGEFDINWDISSAYESELDKSRQNWDRLKGTKQLSDDLCSMVEDPVGADVKIKCGEKEYSAHNFILAVRAKDLLEMCEKSQEEFLDLSQVEGQQIQPESVQAMIKWIYTGKLDVEKNLLPNLSHLAHFCELNELKEYCALKIELNGRKQEKTSSSNVSEEPPRKKIKSQKKSMPLKSIFVGQCQNPDERLGEILKITPWNQRAFAWKLDLPDPSELAHDEIWRVKSPEINFMGIDCYLLLNFGYNDMQRPCFWISLESSPNAEELMDHWGIFIKSKFAASYPGMMSLINSTNPDWYFDDYEFTQLQRHKEEFVYLGESADSSDDEKDTGLCLVEGSVGPRPPRVARDLENPNKFRFKIPARCFLIPDNMRKNDRHIIFRWTLRIDDENREFGKSHTALKKSLFSLSDDFGEICDDYEEEQDLTLECLGRDLTCHKRILMARSSVFKAMLGEGLQEDGDSRVQVKNRHGELVKSKFVVEMLRWVYMGEIFEVGPNFTLPLLELANYYDMGQLKNLCAVKLEGDLSRENVIDVLIVADLVKAEDLKMSAMEFINKNKEIMESADFERKLSEKLRGEIFEAGFSGY